jgi:hypothetical protein
VNLSQPRYGALFFAPRSVSHASTALNGEKAQRYSTKGQTVTKTFEDAAAARRDCERLISSKQSKGYREIQ